MSINDGFGEYLDYAEDEPEEAMRARLEAEDRAYEEWAVQRQRQHQEEYYARYAEWAQERLRDGEDDSEDAYAEYLAGQAEHE